MKRYLALLLALAMLLSVAVCFAGCDDSKPKRKNASKYIDDDDDEDEDEGEDDDDVTPSKPTDPSDPESQPTGDGVTEPDATDPSSPTASPDRTDFSGTAEQVIQAAGIPVVTAGDSTLTNGELQIHYWDNIYYLLNNSYLQYFVDFTKPLSQQYYDATNGITWEKYLLDNALDVYHQMISVCQYAQSVGFMPDAADFDPDATIAQKVQDGEYDSVEDMLYTLYGPGVTVQNYKDYLYTSYYANAYIDYLEASFHPDLLEIDAYYSENESNLQSQGIQKDDSYVHNVRHILLMPAGNTDADWHDCLTAAQSLYNQWLAGEATESSFAELADLYTEDPGSKGKGGLYENIYKNQMVAEFDSWIFDMDHAYGDTGIVKTSYGYHIMFYVEKNPSWIAYTQSVMLNALLTNTITTATETYPLTTDYNAIYLGTPGNFEK